MSRTIGKVGVQQVAEFEVFDSNDALVTNLADIDFAKVLTKQGVVSGLAVTITNLASSGRYKATWTPDSASSWRLRISNATYNPRGWGEDYDVYVDGVPQTVDINSNLYDSASSVDGATVRQALQRISAVLCGKKSGGLNAPVFRSMNDAANRVTATCDNNGDRSAVNFS